MSQVYYIANWQYHEHREMPKRAAWVKAKVSFDDADWMEIAACDDPCAVYAVWGILRGLAVKSPFRGLLLTEGHRTHPHTCKTVALLTRFPLDKIVYAVAFLSDKLGWLVAVDYDDNPAQVSKRVYGKSYCRNEKCSAVTARRQRGNSATTARKDRDVSAETPRRQRGKIAPTGQDITGQDITGEERTRAERADAPDQTENQPARSFTHEDLKTVKDAVFLFGTGQEAIGLQWLKDGHPAWAIAIACAKAHEGGMRIWYATGILKSEAQKKYAGLRSNGPRGSPAQPRPQSVSLKEALRTMNQ